MWNLPQMSHVLLPAQIVILQERALRTSSPILGQGGGSGGGSGGGASGGGSNYDDLDDDIPF